MIGHALRPDTPQAQPVTATEKKSDEIVLAW